MGIMEVCEPLTFAAERTHPHRRGGLWNERFERIAEVYPSKPEHAAKRLITTKRRGNDRHVVLKRVIPRVGLRADHRRRYLARSQVFSARLQG